MHLIRSLVVMLAHWVFHTVSQFQGISLEDEVVSQKPSYEHPVSVNPADAQLLNHPSPAHLLSALESHCAPTTLTALNTHVTQSKAINRHHQVFPKSVGLPIGETKPKSSNGSQIPTALVTPLPGSSPPRHSAEYQMQVGGGVEEGEELRNMGWGKRTTVKTFSTDQSGDVSVFPVAEDSQELHAVKKWKCLIDTKDLVMKQKDAQIERYMVYGSVLLNWCVQYIFSRLCTDRYACIYMH